MAIVPSTDYAGQIDTSDPTGYPHGKAKNVTASGDGTGTPLERNWVNDVFGWFAAFLDSAGITPSGTSDKVGASDMLDAFNTRIATTGNLVAQTYDIISAHDSGKKFSVASQTTSPAGIAFSNGGLRMYITDSDEAWGYDLTTAYDIDTASFDTGNTIDFGVLVMGDFFVKDDGIKAYTVDSAGDDIKQWTMSVAHDISTATDDAEDLDVSVQDINAKGLHISDDGTKLFMFGDNNRHVYRYTMTAWSLTTAVFDSGQDFNATAQFAANAAEGISLSSDGTRMFLINRLTDTVYRYDLTTPFDLTTATYNSVLFFMSRVAEPHSLRFNTNGTRMYTVNSFGDAVFEFTTSHVVLE